MAAYYNENDPKIVAWLRELIKAGLIAEGDVDDRSIVDVQPNDLRGFTQCHFFAGIGGWPYALRLAGWPDDRPVWTGSCPCQPFSQAGRGAGESDARHLWPEFLRLIFDCRPAIVFGEQVASKAGRTWLSAVFADLEALEYRRAATDLCAAGVGAPHIRQRLYWVADRDGSRRRAWRTGEESDRRDSAREQSAGLCDAGDWLADTHRQRREGQRLHLQSGESREAVSEVAGRSEAGRMGDSDEGRSGRNSRAIPSAEGSPERCVRRKSDGAESTSADNLWSACDWLPCLDGKSRPVEPGTFPLAYGVPARVGRLRGYGNAIVPHVAAEFIGAYRDCIGY